MKIKNLLLSIIDQVNREGAFRNIFVTHNALGIFSIHSHISSRSNKPKVEYSSKEAAQKSAQTMSQKMGVHFSVYKCAFCDGWHIGKNAQNKIVQPERVIKPQLPHIQNSYYEQLKNIGIVDFDAVLGKGIRGRTLSSHPWFLPRLKEAGIKNIIDLRTHDTSSKYENLVIEAGMLFHHFEMDSKRTNDRVIIDELPELFKLLDKGSFFISCAMGLHRTDIALSIYYVFHPKVPEEFIPTLKGHRVNGKLRLDDIARRLNSLYRNLTEEDYNLLSLPKDYENEFMKRKKLLFKANSIF